MKACPLAACGLALGLSAPAARPPVTWMLPTALAQAAPAPGPDTGRTDTLPLVVHHFDHKEQIITGSVVMACLIAMVALMNNYNPR